MLGQALGLAVIAEGLEEDATIELLHRCRISRAQGDHFSRPLFANQFAQLVRDLEGRLRSNLKPASERVAPTTVTPNRKSSPVRRFYPTSATRRRTHVADERRRSTAT